MDRIEPKFNFFNQLRSFGFMNVFSSPDFFIAGLIFLLLLIDKHYSLNWFVIGSEEKSTYLMAIFAASSTLFALTTASLSIILSFSTSQFIKFLKSNDRLNKLLFPFWLGNLAYLMVIVLAMLYFILNKNNWYSVIPYIFIITVSLFVYAIGVSFSLLKTIIRIGDWIANYEDNLTKKRD